jgi:hypothetical protein
MITKAQKQERVQLICVTFSQDQSIHGILDFFFFFLAVANRRKC